MKPRLPLLRPLGGLALGFLAFLLARGGLGVPLALLVGAAAGAAGARFLPRMALSRVLWAIPLFLLLLFVAIQMMFLAPGDPFASEKNSSEAVRKEQGEKYGILDRSFVGGAAFFGSYVENLVLSGYMGPSIKVEGRSVTELLLPALPVSLTLGLLSLVLATAIGMTLGIRAGLRPGSVADGLGMGVSMIGVSLPSFVIGALLILVFALKLGWLPVAGWGGVRHLVLPSLTLALPYAAYIARLARSGTIEVMTQDFVRTARAKGLAEREVVMKHAFKGAIVPVVSYLGPAAAQIMTGSFVVETLFGIPGMGQYFVKGAVNRDYFVVLGTMLLYSGFVIFFNLLVDLAYAQLDPRVRGRA